MFWLFLEPHTLLEILDNDLLLFNTFTGQYIEYKNNCRITGLFKSEYSQISETELKDPEIKKLLRDLEKKVIGGTIEAEKFNGLPIRLKSYFEESKTDIIKQLSTDDSLDELTLYLNNKCDLKCPICRQAYKQFLYCTKYKGKYHELELKKIIAFISSIRTGRIAEFNIIGGEIFSYTQIDELIIYFNSLSSYKSYFTDYRNVNSLSTKILRKIRKRNSRIVILINLPFDTTKFKETLITIKKTKLDYCIKLVIKSSIDIELAISILSKNKERISYDLLPFYTGNNLPFFENYVFLTKENILCPSASINKIKLKKQYNLNDFRRLTVLPDAEVYSNINTSSLGSLSINSLHEIISKEQKRKEGWFRLRSKVSPCNECIYCSLCPSLTNYEISVGKNNLCNIK